jgi:hypothetical protein
MRKRDELTNPDSCMSRARDDEWTFVLLGRDVAAVATVRAWINERLRLGKNQPHDAQIREADMWCEVVSAELRAAGKCTHPEKLLSPGPRTPARWGTHETVICSGCGRWRTSGGLVGVWRAGPVPTEREEEV